MAKVERTAEVQWEGDLVHGKGDLALKSSEAAGPLPITWASRIERPDGKTSPEELLAAAHAGCYAMALSHTLAQRGKPPERVEVRATCALEQVGEGYKVTTVELRARAIVPGMKDSEFHEAARAADQACPVSNAIRGNVDIRLDAELELRLEG